MPRTLRPYQVDAIAGIRSALGGHASTACVLPTGCGKTSVAATLMNEWPGGHCLFLAHTRELVDQAAARLADELGYPPVVEMGSRGGDTGLFYQGGMVVVGSVQSMVTDRRLTKYDRHPFDLIVVDEAHRATSGSYRKIVDHFTAINKACKVVGLTATPNRADGTALGLVFESVGFAMDIPDAIDGGWLVPVRQRSVVVSDVEITGPSRTNELGEKDFTDAAVESVMLDERALAATADPLVREAAGRPTIVFAATVRHAHQLAAVIDRLAPGAAAAVDGETPPEQRADVIAKFRTGQIQFLCNAQLFTEGFDAPNCSCVAVARPTKSAGRYTQMVGRGLRPLPGVVDIPGDAQDRDDRRRARRELRRGRPRGRPQRPGRDRPDGRRREPQAGQVPAGPGAGDGGPGRHPGERRVQRVRPGRADGRVGPRRPAEAGDDHRRAARAARVARHGPGQGRDPQLPVRHRGHRRHAEDPLHRQAAGHAPAVRDRPDRDRGGPRQPDHRRPEGEQLAPAGGVARMSPESLLDRLLSQLERRGLRVVPGPGGVSVRGPEHEITPAVLDALKAFKPQLLERFAAGGRPEVPVPIPVPPPPLPPPPEPLPVLCRVCRRDASDPENRARLADPAFCDRGREARCPYKT
jgi:superfamily II DNA or RNA helicase